MEVCSGLVVVVERKNTREKRIGRNEMASNKGNHQRKVSKNASQRGQNRKDRYYIDRSIKTSNCSP